MIIYECDGCGHRSQDVLEFRTFQIPCHLDPNDPAHTRGYVTPQGEAVSGRLVDKLLCHKCNNRVLTKAVEEIQTIRNSKPNKEP